MLSILEPMGTPAERKALLFLALVAVLGAGVRAFAAPSGPGTTDAEARRALRLQMNAVEQARRDGRRSKAGQGSKKSATSGATRASTATGSSRTPRSPGQPAPALDVDRASAAELEQLPGIGPALALRIVDDRNRNGPFGSITNLQRVRGIGPALSNRLTPHVTFSGTPRPTSADLGGRSRATGASASSSEPGAERRAGRMSIPP